MTAGVVNYTQSGNTLVTVLPAAGSQQRWQYGRAGDVQVSQLGTAVVCGSGQRLSAQQLAERFRDQGAGLMESLAGEFAAVIETSQEGRVRLYSDRFASQRLYYAQDGARLLVSDEISGLISGLPIKPTLSNDSIVNYLFFHMIPSPDTIYDEVSCLGPAEELCWSGSVVSRKRYWTPVFGEQRQRSEAEYADELASVLEQVCADQARLSDRAGCFLSGGLDSSSISGMVAREKPGVDVFSIGFPVEQYNEIGYARTAVKQFGLSGHEYFMTPEDVVDALPLIAGSMSQPFGNSSVMPAYFCAKLANTSGVNHLIAGDGGDELFAGNERYSQQLKFERWRQRLSPVMGLLNFAFVKTRWPESFRLAAKAGSFTRQVQMPITERLEYFNFLNLTDRQQIFSAELLSSVDIRSPEKHGQALFEELQASDLNRMLYLDWKHTLADNDLVKVNSMCRLAGVDVSYPMLDHRLVDFSLQVPSDIKLVPGNLRHLYKLAMKDFLPEKIINKPKHGFGLPFGIWTAEHKQLRTLAYDAIDSLNCYDLFRPGFIDEVKRQHQEVHAKHYGELIWVLMILALWIDGQNSKP